MAENLSDSDEDWYLALRRALVPDGQAWYITAGQIILALTGLMGALLRAFPIQQRAEHENYPVVDAITIAWIALIVLAFVLPHISEVTFGATSLKFREAKKSAEDLRLSVDELAYLTQNWSTSATIFIALLATSASLKGMLLFNYLRDRMGEAKVFLADDPRSEVRIALWLYFEESKKIEFFFSNEVHPTQRAYASGEGMIGQVFLEGRAFNEPDVRSLPAYKHTRKVDPPYRAVICVPVRIGDEVIGVLTADKTEATLFNPIADDLAKGLAAQCAFAIDQYRKIR